MDLVKSLNLGVRFLLELCLLAALAYSGLHLSDSIVIKWGLFLILPGSAALVWGKFIAPKSDYLLGQPKKLFVELVLFGTAIGLLATVNKAQLAIAFTAIVLLNEVLLLIWKQ